MASRSRQVAFRPGLNRPAGTFVEMQADTPTTRRHTWSGEPLEHYTDDMLIAQMTLAEEEMIRGDAPGAERRMRALEDIDMENRPLLAARLYFDLGNANRELARLKSSDGYFARCAALLERAVGASDPSLVPCLFNRGCVLVQRGLFPSAEQTLRRARGVCDGLFSVPRKSQMRSHILHALAIAIEGCGRTDEAEATYRTALSAAEDDERSSGVPRPQPQPSRAALASLLQARGDHAGALKLLDTERAAWRKARAAGRRQAWIALELAHAAGRAAIAAFALHREQHAMLALREALSAGRAARNNGVTQSASARAVPNDPLQLARETAAVMSRARTAIHST